MDSSAPDESRGGLGGDVAEYSPSGHWQDPAAEGAWRQQDRVRTSRFTESFTQSPVEDPSRIVRLSHINKNSTK